MPIAPLPDCEMCYEITGAGRPALVFIHGGYCSHEDWCEQTPELSKEFCVVTVDQRGHGASSGECGAYTIEQAAKDVRDLVDYLQLGPAVIIGHSLGARVALQTAADWRESVRGLVLLDGSRLRSVSPSTAQRAPERSEGQMRAFMVAAFDAMFSAGFGENIRQQAINKIGSTALPDVLAFFKVVEQWDIERVECVLDEVGGKVPVLAIQSTYHDHATPRYSLKQGDTTPWLELLKSRLAKLQIRIAPDLGHFLMAENPKLTNELIGAFARSLA